MNLEPQITQLEERKLIGKRLSMCFENNKTGELWRSFMPQKKEIKKTLNNDLISLQVYPPQFSFNNPQETFIKWASIEVSDFEEVPVSMETFILESGLYAVFHYQGSSSDTSIFTYIFGTWLPNSIYTLDERPHFEILGEKYKNNHPDSEEEIWIPIKKRA